MPLTPSKLARYVVTGIESPVAADERDARWTKAFSQPTTPTKENMCALEEGRRSPVKTALASTPPRVLGERTPTSSPQRTVPASAFKKTPVKPIAQPVFGPPKDYTPKTAAIEDAKAGFLLRKQRPSSAIVERSPRSSMDVDSPAALAYPVRPALDARGRASYEQRDLDKSLGPGSAMAAAEAPPARPASSMAVPRTTTPPTLMDQRKSQIEAQFAALLDRMQIDPAVRTKMLGTELAIKESMLKSSAAQTAAREQGPPVPRKSKSIASLRQRKDSDAAPDGFVFVSPTTPVDVVRPRTPSTKRQRTSSFSSQRSGKDTSGGPGREPERWAMHLKATARQDLLPSAMISLRILLRTESPEWIAEWARYGGYRGLLDRLGDILAVEWRDEQHDDQLLFELLRCLKAMMMTEVGRDLLAGSAPAPFRSLVELLYSEKRPGDLPARQAIVELVQGLFEVFPPGSTQVPPLDPREWGTAMLSLGLAPSPSDLRMSDDSPLLPMLARSASSRPSARSLVQTLMVGPPNEREEATVDFIRTTRRARVYKKWLDEISSVIADYFWCFAHSLQGFMRLEDISESSLVAPKAPSGMTGGVESVAMSYICSHLRLINMLLRQCSSSRDSRLMFEDLLESGLDKVLSIMRKCSRDYYPHIHLELARMLDIAAEVGAPLPDSIQRHIREPGAPPLPPPKSPAHRRSLTAPSLPTFDF